MRSLGCGRSHSSASVSLSVPHFQDYNPGPNSTIFNFETLVYLRRPEQVAQPRPRRQPQQHFYLSQRAALGFDHEHVQPCERKHIERCIDHVGAADPQALQPLRGVGGEL